MQQAKPNILFVMADQLAASALPFHGHPLVQTSHLSRLAAEGVVFENCYSTSPLCAPARATVMNGLLPSRTGVYDNAAEFPSSIPTWAHYLRLDDPAGKFFTQLMLFMAAMLGVALSDNLLLLVVFWELTSISSFLLVGYWGHKADARAGARMALAVTGGGGLVMLAGIVLLGQMGGSYDLSELLTRGEQIKAHALYPLMLLLILVGCFTKSAQIPFHFWLPEAMAAPTPVSAYLHSATMVKAGIFLLARLYPVIGGTEMFQSIVVTVGLSTMVFGAYVAVFRHDIKSLLAYSTISHLGLIVFLIGLASPLSAVAAVFHILNHATFKASLFMTAGIIDH